MVQEGVSALDGDTVITSCHDDAVNEYTSKIMRLILSVDTDETTRKSDHTTQERPRYTQHICVMTHRHKQICTDIEIIYF